MHDVVVIGAGPGGSAAAYYLARRGLDVLLLDKADFPRDKTCGDGLTPRAVSVLQDMGLADDLRRIGHVIRRFEVFAPNGRSTGDAIILSDVPSPTPRRRPEAGEAGIKRRAASRNGEGEAEQASDALPDYALVVPRLQLDDRIRQQAVRAGARFAPGVRVDDIRIERLNGAERVEVKGEHNGRRTSFQARLAVIATGANVALLLRSGLLTHQPKAMVAARAYFQGVRGLSDAWTLRFDSAPLPGYGWVFPIASDAANIGVGYFKRDRAASALGPFQSFVRSPAIQALLADARQAGPIKGYPLRDDFLTSPTFGRRMLLVGEAAGLVNPLTGEGIDYALESGRIAAAHAFEMFADGDFTWQQHAAYDQALHSRFQALFEFCTWVRDHCANRITLNVLVAAANHRRDLRQRLMRVVLGGAAIHGKLTVGRVLRALVGRR